MNNPLKGLMSGRCPHGLYVAMSNFCCKDCEIDALKARLAKVERDAARYRWLRRINAGGIHVYNCNVDAHTSIYGDDLDSTIDAAMAADSASQAQENKE